MARQKEDRRHFSSTMKTDLYKSFDKLVKENGYVKSKLLDRAIELLLEEKKGNS